MEGKKKPPVMNERGIALIMVVLIMTVIVALTLQFNAASRSQVYEAAGTSDGILLEYIAKSGIYIGKALLKEERETVVSFQDNWFRAGELSLQSEDYFDIGLFDLLIIDESGKIPINYLVKGNAVRADIRDFLVRFLSLPEFGLSEQEAYDIVDAITDWIDEDDDITGFGAEQGYYRGLDPPYDCKNGPLDSIDEVLLIKGITRSLYYGGDGRRGIKDFFTLHGAGRININTAPLPILKVLSPDITDDMAVGMDEYRRDEANSLSSSTWYKNVAGMGNVDIDARLIGTGSDVFSVVSTGRMDRMTRRFTAIVEREKPGDMPVIVSWTVH